jgi:hypothetical protein
VLIKSVIEAIPVYWHLLANIPKGILIQIRNYVLIFSGKEVQSILDHTL